MIALLIGLCLTAAAVVAYIRITKNDKSKPTKGGGGTITGDHQPTPVE